MDASQIVADPTTADQLYVAISDNTKGGVFKSTNGGISWTMASSGITDLAIHSLALDPSHPGTLWAGSYFGALYHSTNGGASWSSVAAGLPGGQRLMGIVVSPTTGQVFVGMAGGGVWTSPDGGATWAASNGGLSAVQPGAILVDPVDSATIYAGTTNGAYKSSDAGASWKQLTNGNATFPGNVDLQWYGMAADKSTTPPTIYGAVLNVGVLKSTDAGVTWTTLTGTQLDLVGLVAGAPIAPSTLATLWTASQSSNQAYRSTDGGATWTIVTVAPVGTLINGIAIDPTNSNNLYLATSAGVYKSTNASAASVSFALSSMGINSSTLSAIAIDPVTPTTLYAGDRDGQLVKSIDGAQNWIQIGFANANVTALAVDPNNQASIYLSTFGNGLLKSINDGSSFNSVTQQHYRMYTAIAIDRVNPGTVYAASFGKGIFKTTSSGM